MTDIIEKLAALGPEITLLIGACLCLAMGLSGSMTLRRLSGAVAALALVVTAALALAGEQSLPMQRYVQAAIACVGLLLVLIAVAVPEKLILRPTNSTDLTDNVDRGEFFGFLLLSLTGAMLCAGAGDLVWLFMSLELTSLPTYVLAAMSRRQLAAKEAAVKYFFLGAMASAVFLYGFTLIYGATGTTNFDEIRRFVGDDPSTLMTLGLLLAVLGIAFKIAAAPMHFYAADVYQGVATPITAFLAFVPKTAGFVAIILLLQLVGWPLPPAMVFLLWVMAAATMTIGNVLGLLQTNVKRILAYSSIAHSGYMLLGLLGNDSAAAVPGAALGNGVAAVLFYLPAYGLATMGAFAVLACLERRGHEAQTLDDLAGLSKRSPFLATVMLISVLSLIGLPPMVGLLGKVYLFGSAMTAGFYGLVVIAVVNSAVSAVYYLRIVGACFFAEPNEQTCVIDSPIRRGAAGMAAVLTVFLFFRGGPLVDAALKAATSEPTKAPTQMLVRGPIDKASTLTDPRSSQAEAQDRSGH